MTYTRRDFIRDLIGTVTITPLLNVPISYLVMPKYADLDVPVDDEFLNDLNKFVFAEALFLDSIGAVLAVGAVSEAVQGVTDICFTVVLAGVVERAAVLDLNTGEELFSLPGHVFLETTDVMIGDEFHFTVGVAQ